MFREVLTVVRISLANLIDATFDVETRYVGIRLLSSHQFTGLGMHKTVCPIVETYRTDMPPNLKG